MRERFPDCLNELVILEEAGHDVSDQRCCREEEANPNPNIAGTWRTVGVYDAPRLGY